MASTATIAQIALLGTHAYSSTTQLAQKLGQLRSAYEANCPLKLSGNQQHFVRAIKNWGASALRLQRQGVCVERASILSFNELIRLPGLVDSKIPSVPLGSIRANKAAPSAPTEPDEDDESIEKCCVCYCSTNAGTISSCGHTLCRGMLWDTAASNGSGFFTHSFADCVMQLSKPPLCPTCRVPIVLLRLPLVSLLPQTSFDLKPSLHCFAMQNSRPPGTALRKSFDSDKHRQREREVLYLNGLSRLPSLSSTPGFHSPKLLAEHKASLRVPEASWMRDPHLVQASPKRTKLLQEISLEICVLVKEWRRCAGACCAAHRNVRAAHLLRERLRLARHKLGKVVYLNPLDKPVFIDRMLDTDADHSVTVLYSDTPTANLKEEAASAAQPQRVRIRHGQHAMRFGYRRCACCPPPRVTLQAVRPPLAAPPQSSASSAAAAAPAPAAAARSSAGSAQAQNAARLPSRAATPPRAPYGGAAAARTPQAALDRLRQMRQQTDELRRIHYREQLARAERVQAARRQLLQQQQRDMLAAQRAQAAAAAVGQPPVGGRRRARSPVQAVRGLGSGMGAGVVDLAGGVYRGGRLQQSQPLYQEDGDGVLTILDD